MKLPTKTTYGVRAMCDLAIHFGQGPVSATDISEREDISLEYLEQLLNRLKRQGLVLTIRGPKGGYVLARKPDRITILEIVEALGNSVDPVFCVSENNVKKCNRLDRCVTRILWKELADKTKEILQGTSLRDLCQEAKTLLKDKKDIHRYTFHI
jgi:Rrf2 family protein